MKRLMKIFRISNLMRVFGGLLLLFYGGVLLAVFSTWSEQNARIDLLILFFILFFMPGALLVGAGAKLDRKSEARRAIQQNESFTEATGSSIQSERGERVDSDDGKAQRVSSAADVTEASATQPMKMIVCSSCGAQNSLTLPNTTAICEYCGSMVADTQV